MLRCSTPTSCPNPAGCAAHMAALLAEPRAAFVQTRIEWGNGEKNWLTRAQRLDAGRAFRRRAGYPRPPRHALPVQRHGRHLAARGGRGGGRLVARHAVGGSRPGAADLARGLARRFPDGAACRRRAAGRRSTISAPSRAAGPRASCRSRASCWARSGMLGVVERGQVHDHGGARPAAHLSGAGGRHRRRWSCRAIGHG